MINNDASYDWAPGRPPRMLTPERITVTLEAGEPDLVIERNGETVSTRQTGSIRDSLRHEWDVDLTCRVVVSCSEPDRLANAATFAEWIVIACGGGTADFAGVHDAMDRGRAILNERVIRIGGTR